MSILPLLLSLPIVGLMPSCASPNYAVIDADKAVIRAPKLKSFTPSIDGWFIPDARWLEINEALTDDALK